MDSGGPATDAIRRGRVKSSRVPLAALGTFSLAPSATLSFHKENSVIAEGLVLLGEGILEFSELGVLCFCWTPSGAPGCCHNVGNSFSNSELRMKRSIMPLLRYHS